MLFMILFFVGDALSSSCEKLTLDAERILCVCNSTYCDEVPHVPNLEQNEGFLIYSSMSGDRLTSTKINMKQPMPSSIPEIEIILDPGTTFQKLLGFGGAFTDSSGINMRALSKPTRDNLLKSYFSDQGLKYRLGRVPIASTDFSLSEYSYADENDDFALEKFKLARADFEFKIPFIQEAQRLSNNSIKLFASPWSPPAWMKTNKRMKGGGVLIGDQKGKYYKTWAKYFERFFDEYAKNNVTFWGLTVQNEPSSGIDPNYGWQTLYLNASMEKDFVKNHLGPLLRGNPLTRNLTIIGLDDNRGLLPTWADEIYNDKDASQYFDGMGVHWYMNAVVPSWFLTKTHQQHPNKFILATEACTGYFLFHGPKLGSWSRAESYAEDIIENFNNWVVGWTDWNLCLDLNGGPTWAQNFVDAPVLVNATADQFYKQPMYYAMAHFSSFIPVEAIRINYSMTDKQLKMTAFADKTHQIVVILNKENREKSIRLAQTHYQNKSFHFTIKPRSITTLTFKTIN